MKAAEVPTASYEVRSVTRALDLLTALAQAPDGTLDLASLAQTVDLPPSTAFRLLESLAARDFVRSANGKGYQVGPRAFEVGSAFLRGASIWSRAADLAEQVANRTKETASVGVLDGAEVLYVAIAHGQRDVGIQSLPGTRHPAYCTALGKAILAALGLATAKSILDRVELTRLTPHTVTSFPALSDELTRIAHQGYAVDNEERAPGVRCVGVPIWNHTGAVVAAISASGPAFRMQGKAFDDVRDAVVETGAHATRELGGRVRWEQP